MRSRKNTQSLLPYLVLNQMLVGSPFIRKNKLSRLTLACRLWLSVFNQRIFPCCTLSPYTVQKLNKGCLFVNSLNQMFLYYYLNQRPQNLIFRLQAIKIFYSCADISVQVCRCYVMQHVYRI